MTSQLTPNGISRINFEASGSVVDPLVQVCTIKPVTGGDKVRYRLSLSDGVHYMNGILVTQINHLVENNELVRYSIIRIKKYTCNLMPGANTKKRMCIILDLEVVAKDNEKPIGNPVAIESVAESTGTTPTTSISTTTGQGQTTPNNNNKHSSVYHQTPPSASPAKTNITPIADINLYNNRWTIRAVVEAKGDLKKYTNAKGEGQLCTVEFRDESGVIRATAWGDVATKVQDELEMGKVYYISKGQLKQANKQFNNTGHPYEMDLRSATWSLCTDNTSVPAVVLKLVSIADIEKHEPKTTIDVIAVVKSAAPINIITAKSSGRQVPKRDLTLVDDSNREIVLALWGSAAENYNREGNPIILVKGAVIGDFGGRTLSAREGSLTFDPDMPESHRLRGWYDSIGSASTTSSLSMPLGATPGEVRWNDERLSLATMKSRATGDDKPIYFITTGFITMCKKEHAYYKACTTEGCNKKLNETTGGYFCEKCNKAIDGFKIRLMLNMSVVDSFGQGWITAFHDQAEQILGITGEDLHQLNETNTDMYDAVFTRANFTHAMFKLRGKPEIYQDEARMRITMQAQKPVDFKSESANMLAEISRLRGR